VRASSAQPRGIRPGRRALLSLSCLALSLAAAIAAWPVLEPRLETAAAEAGRGQPVLLVAAGLLFAATTASCGVVWHYALRREGAPIGRVDACARYGVGSLVNSFAPAKAGDVVRVGLLLQALPRGRRAGIARCFATVQGARIVVLACLVLAAALPWTLAAVAVVALLGCCLWLFGRGARTLLELAVLSPAAKVTAAACLLTAVHAPSPLHAAFAVVPALELAALLPLTPGNVGVASTAVAMALHARGMAMPEAVSAGIVLHAVETAAGICFGTAAALTVAGRARGLRAMRAAEPSLAT
jgi:hypothetical protein